ncbi:hypothetical protein QTP88_001465 [Uroleucon formosanum]
MHNLKIQPDKCEFVKRECIYLRHVISETGIRPDPKKIQAVLDFPEPKNVKQIKSFLGLSGYYRKFIENYSAIAKPITNLLKKDVAFNWSEECDRAFGKLKHALCTEPVLQYPDFTKEFILTKDASGKALGAILSQGKIGKDLPIAYASRTLSPSDSNYSTTELECLAIVYRIKQFRPYLYGKKFTILSDHRPLAWLFNLKDPLSKLARWRIKLEQYDYVIKYKQGVQNGNVDALSRMYTINEIKNESYNKLLEKFETTLIANRHAGIGKTIKKIKRQFNWPGLKVDVKNYIKNCESCQKNKVTNKKIKQPMVITSTSSKPFEKIFLDIVGPLVTTASGNNYILTMQDDLTKYSLGVPLPNYTVNTVAEAFVVNFVCSHGIPGTILTDQGTDSLSKTFAEVCKLLKINKIKTSPCHPQANGSLERSHRTLAEYLRHYVDKDLNTWDQLTPYALFVYNSTEHTSTGYQPYTLLYGKELNIPESHKIAKERLIKKKLKSRSNYDKIAHSEELHVKDSILLKDNAQKNNLNSLWKGPIPPVGKATIIYREEIPPTLTGEESLEELKAGRELAFRISRESAEANPAINRHAWDNYAMKCIMRGRGIGMRRAQEVKGINNTNE